MKHQPNFRDLLKCVALLVSISLLTACGGGGGGGDVGPPPAIPVDTSITSVLDTSWTTVSHSPEMKKVVFNGTKYIGVGLSGYIADSTDGITWTQRDTGGVIHFKDVAVSGTNAVAVPGSGNFSGAVLTISGNFSGAAYTINGTDWQLVDLASEVNCKQLTSVTHDGIQFVGVFGSISTGNNSICTSADGATWALAVTHNGQEFKGIVAGGGKYVLLSVDGIAVVTAPDSTNTDVPNVSGALNDLIYANSKFVGITSARGVITSDDGTTWLEATGSVLPMGVISVSYSAAKGFSAYGPRVLYTSADAVIWTAESDPIIASALTPFVVNGTNESLVITDETIHRSTDNAIWSKVNAVMPAGQIQAYLNHNGTLYAAGNRYGGLHTKTGSADWVAANNTLGNIGFITSLIHDGSTIMAAGIYAGTGGIATLSGNTLTTVFSYSVNGQIGVSGELNGTMYYFGQNGKALKSIDDGQSFSIEENVPIPGNQSGVIQPYKQAVGNGTTLVVTTVKNDVFSLTGSTWTVALRYGIVPGSVDTQVPGDVIHDLVWSGTNFVIAGANGLVKTSPDGITWTDGNWGNTTQTITDVLVVGTTLYAVDIGGIIKSSTDHGATWVEIETITTINTVSQLAYDGMTFYAFGSAGTLGALYSTAAADASSWTLVSNTLADNFLGSRHIIYDATSSEFVSLLNSGGGFYSSADGISWTYGTTVPADPAYAYLAAKKSLGKIADGLFEGLAYDGTTYTAGGAFSENGVDWFLRVPANAIVGHTGIANEPTELFKELSSNSYVLLTKSIGIRRIYSSTDASNWGIPIAEIDTMTNDGVEAVQTASDIEFDGTNYLVLMNDLYNDPQIGQPAAKGNYILKIVDADTVSLLEMAIHPILQDLILESDGSYTVTGDEGMIATHGMY